MLNPMLAQDVFSSAQFDQMLKSFDEWLQIYTEATLVLFVVVLGLLAWLVFCEARQSKASQKNRSNHQALKESQLLRTEP
jgi:cytoskeletal protein RodZ